jgi:Glu-tRNA(Gln) amidotransferase subunit E-like FAD-binding protein
MGVSVKDRFPTAIPLSDLINWEVDMGKQIAIKVSRVKLLEKLKQAHRKATSEQLVYDIACQNIEKLQEKQNAQVIKLLSKAAVDVRNSSGYYDRQRNQVEFTITAIFPDSMFPSHEKPEHNGLSRFDMDELSNVIKLLEMSDEENVSTSTYGNVARFL